MRGKKVSGKGKFFVHCGEYKAIQSVGNETEAACRTLRYMMAESIPCNMLMLVSPNRSMKPIRVYFVPRVLDGMGEFDQAEGMRKAFVEKGVDVGLLESRFGEESEVMKMRKEVALLQKNLAETKAQIADREDREDECESEQDS